MSIEDRCRGRDDYRALLARMWGIHAPLDAALEATDWSGLDIDYGERSKLSWLADDLAWLGLDAAALAALPRSARLPRLAAPVDAMGALYVLEGASLGGQIIARQLKGQLGVVPGAGGTFFASYGERIGENWRRYLAALERFSDSPPAAARIEAAALETFESFLVWFGEDAEPGQAARRVARHG